ncbi:HD domain-containing phosphohydrolase [Zoogloea sp.]|uniref:HD-GYP domain-containing protein n=1 Tax=Zoogloea sp. TaxID=49181 RepID=UPI001416B2F6|nr:MAG: HD domain-containing protein [Zoogloea sp.]
MKISLQRTIAALTGALDFVGIDEVHHGKRVALFAFSIANELSWEKSRCLDMLYAGMLHDCGVARTEEHRHLTDTLEWDGAQAHCERGQTYLLACPPLQRFATATRWHHTRWEDLADEPLSAAERLETNLIFLADRLDVLLAPYITADGLKNEILWEYPAIVERLAGMSGCQFSPELIGALQRAAGREDFWLQCDPPYVHEVVDELLMHEAPIELSSKDALAIAGLFARTVDSKSVYTLEHSTRVAQLTRYLAQARGVSGVELDLLEIAALLHDIGKLRVPEEIIDKPGRISIQERAIVRRHSYDTGRILKKVFPSLPLAEWASMHHEDLIGTGYPSQLHAKDIPWQARLIAVADIFQALSQDRPYRPRLESSAVMAHLDELLAEGRLDAGLVELLRHHVDCCYRLAVHGELPA